MVGGPRPGALAVPAEGGYHVVSHLFSETLHGVAHVEERVLVGAQLPAATSKSSAGGGGVLCEHLHCLVTALVQGPGQDPGRWRRTSTHWPSRPTLPASPPSPAVLHPVPPPTPQQGAGPELPRFGGALCARAPATCSWGWWNSRV